MAGKHRYRRIATLREILGRGHRARPPVATAPGCTIAFADGPTGIAHRVTDAAFSLRGVAPEAATSPSVAPRSSP